jgi:hypothetical protein
MRPKLPPCCHPLSSSDERAALCAPLWLPESIEPELALVLEENVAGDLGQLLHSL